MQGVAISPVEALPSATITELFFLHERGGGGREDRGLWVLFVGGEEFGAGDGGGGCSCFGVEVGFLVMGVGVCGVGLWGLVPETFWDRGLGTFLEEGVDGRGRTGEGRRRREDGGEW